MLLYLLNVHFCLFIKINNFDFIEKLNSVSELSDGLILSKLIALIVGKDQKERRGDFKEKSKETYFALIQWFFQHFICNEETENMVVKYDDAKMGVTFELGKVSTGLSLLLSIVHIGGLWERVYSSKSHLTSLSQSLCHSVDRQSTFV